MITPFLNWIPAAINTVIKYGTTLNYLKTANIFQHDVYIEIYNCSYEFFVSILFIVFGNQRVTQCGPRRFMTMYDQLTICILKRNVINLEDYARLLKHSEHDT